MSGIVASLLLLMQIEGAGSCPSPADVEDKLAPLLPADFAAASADRAMIAESADGSLWLSLARPDGTMVASRRLPRARTCADQAETVAVALAVWEAQIHPEISLRLDRLAGTSPATAAAEPPRAPAPAGIVLARTPAAPGGPALTAAPALGVGAVGSWQPDSAAPGARVDATLGAPRGRWRARLSLTGIGRHASSLPPGQARWWRLYAAVGADYAHPLGQRWQVTLGVAGALGTLGVAGDGFSIDRATRGVDLGAEALLRAELRLGSVKPWLGLAFAAWLRRQTVEVTGAPTSTVLPWYQPLIVLGADFCRRC